MLYRKLESKIIDFENDYAKRETLTGEEIYAMKNSLVKMLSSMSVFKQWTYPNNVWKILSNTTVW